MLLILKTAVAVLALTLVIPLAVWAITGNGRHAWHAWCEFALIMGAMVLIGCGLGLIGWVSGA